NELRETGLVPPAELLMRLACVAEKHVDFRWPEIARIDTDQNLPADFINPDFIGALPLPHDTPANFGKGQFDKFPHGMGFARCQHIVVRLVLLDDPPHALDIIARMSPITARIDIAEKQNILQPELNGSNGPCDLACNE